MKAFTVAVALAALLAVAVAVPEERIVKAHACVAQGSCGLHDYARVARADTTKTRTITLGTTQNNFAASCGSALHEVSDPGACSYIPFVLSIS